MKHFNRGFGCNIEKTQEFKERERLRLPLDPPKKNFNPKEPSSESSELMFFFFPRLVCRKSPHRNFKVFGRKKPHIPKTVFLL
jgi:hypothetical protein